MWTRSFSSVPPTATAPSTSARYVFFTVWAANCARRSPNAAAVRATRTSPDVSASMRCSAPAMSGLSPTPTHSGHRTMTPFMSVPVSWRVSGWTGMPAGLSNASNASSSKMHSGRTARSGVGRLSSASSRRATSTVSPPLSFIPFGAGRPFTRTSPASQASRTNARGTEG